MRKRLFGALPTALGNRTTGFEKVYRAATSEVVVKERNIVNEELTNVRRCFHSELFERSANIGEFEFGSRGCCGRNALRKACIGRLLK